MKKKTEKLDSWDPQRKLWSKLSSSSDINEIKRRIAELKKKAE